MVNRRQLLGALSWPAAAAYGGAFLSPARRAHALTVAERLATHPGAAGELADDEYFWYDVRQAFSAEAGIINLNSGGVSPSPLPVQDAMKRYLDYSNTSPTYAMWQILEPQREQIRERLAMEWDTDAEELALVRNASEGLQICQFGIDLEPDDAIVRLFESNITPRTRIIHMCHMINLTGQILPVAKVTNMARRRGIPVIVDGAHTLAHFDFKISDLECDYYATSLHKWLFAPHGTGLLYVRRDKIRDLWPLMAAHERNDENIRKFEEIGTHPAANYLAIGDALTFHQGIGAKRKEARLVYLRDHWANVGVEGIDTSTLNDWLWTEHRIITVAINHAEFTGLRISPSVFTTLEELDRFCDAIEQAVKQGISA